MEALDLDAVDETLFDALGFKHPLIVLMPYAAEAPAPLLALQAAVWRVMNPDLSYDERVVAALGIRRATGKVGLSAKEAAAVAIDLLRGLNDLLLSPAVLEQYCWACLELGGVRLEDGTFSSPPQRPLPVLVRTDAGSGKLVPVGHMSDQARVLDVWTNTSLELSSKQAQELSMSALDLRASLRMLMLFLMYAETDRAQVIGSKRLERFEEMGLSLWDALLAQLRDTLGFAPNDEEQFGPAVQNAMWHFLRSRSMANSLSKPGNDAQDSSTTVRTTSVASMHVIVRGQIPPGSSDEDRQALARYECFRAPLPVARLPDLAAIDAVRTRLASEFPWAEPAVEAIVDDLQCRSLFGGIELGMVPTLFVGLPGCGKSRLARRIAEELGVPFLAMSLAGMGDSRAILGTARGWTNGEASPLLRLLAERRAAGALVMLDEIDKACSGTRNDVPPTSALLNLLEVENSRCWYDTFLQAACDLSKMMYIATANRLSSIPKPLISRMRIVHIPEPRRQDFGVIARGALMDIAREWGLPPDVFNGIAQEVPLGKARNAREIRSFAQGYLGDWSRRALGPGRVH